MKSLKIKAIPRDPISSEDILSGFYRPLPAVGDRVALPRPAPRTASEGGKARPAHYKIVCISLYTEDIERLDQLVKELKRRGHTKANKSQVIRAALEQIDLDKVPRSR